MPIMIQTSKGLNSSLFYILFFRDEYRYQVVSDKKSEQTVYSTLPSESLQNPSDRWNEL